MIYDLMIFIRYNVPYVDSMYRTGQNHVLTEIRNLWANLKLRIEND